MNTDDNNQEKKFCVDDNRFRIHCTSCDKLCIDRYYNNHPKSGIHITNNRKEQQLNNTK